MPASLTPRKVKRYGWIRDLPDHRDLLYAAPAVEPKTLPPSVDLRRGMPAVYDQGHLGSCTANAIAAAVAFARKKARKTPTFVPSRLFVYYNERVIMGTVAEDSGAQLRDGMKAVAKQGVCPEASRPANPADWPYVIEDFAKEPPKACYKFGLANQITAYKRIPQALTAMRACLAEGFPFVFGIAVYESFESPEVAKTGVVNLPTASERMVGGHAVCAVGYDDATQRFLVRNSWGPGWGQKGYFTMPYAYLTETNLSADFWTVRQTE